MARELAIVGGQPTFDEPLHVGRPNVGDVDEFLARMRDVLERRWLTNSGPLVLEFERRIADYVGVRNCVAMCNATIALEVVIRALELEGEVIVPSMTFVATPHALWWQKDTRPQMNFGKSCSMAGYRPWHLRWAAVGFSCVPSSVG